MAPAGYHETNSAFLGYDNVPACFFQEIFDELEFWRLKYLSDVFVTLRNSGSLPEVVSVSQSRAYLVNYSDS